MDATTTEQTTKIDLASLLCRAETFPAAADASVRITDRGHAWFDVPGFSPRIFASRWDRTEVVARHIADLQGPRGAAVVAAIQAGSPSAERRAWRLVGA